MTTTRSRRWTRLAGLALALPGLAWSAASAALWLGQERLLFKPVPLAADVVLATEPDVHERFVEVPGARLSVLELRLPQPRGVVFFLHGNNDNLQSWFVNTALYRRANLDLVMMDYRGYGKSSGRIASEAQLHDDVQAVWRSLGDRYAGRPVVVLGRSLGTGLAARLAAQIQPDLTLLVSPYASMLALAQQHYPWVPRQALRYPLRSDLALGAVRGPVVLIHGERDALIPLQHSLELQARAPQARQVTIAGAGHADLQDFPDYEAALDQALRTLR